MGPALALVLLVPALALGAPADPAMLRGQLREARAQIDAGQADRALAPLFRVLENAAAESLLAEEAAAALLFARALARVGEARQALALLPRAMRQARAAGDGRLALTVAREAALLSRRLGSNAHADAYVALAREEASKGKFEERGADAFDVGELPRPVRLPPEVPVIVRPETPLGMYSARSAMAAFRARIKNDPEFLAGLTHLKEFRDDPATSGIETLEYPGVPVEVARTFKDDYRTVSRALGYYKFALKLGKTLDDEFALATLYVNMTFLRTDDHPALRWVYGLTKAAAIAEAASRIIGFHATGGAMDLTILALDKLLIDVIRRYDGDGQGGSSPTDDLLGSDD